jgi:hypothetical protein
MLRDALYSKIQRDALLQEITSQNRLGQGNRTPEGKCDRLRTENAPEGRETGKFDQINSPPRVSTQRAVRTERGGGIL